MRLRCYPRLCSGKIKIRFGDIRQQRNPVSEQQKQHDNQQPCRLLSSRPTFTQTSLPLKSNDHLQRWITGRILLAKITWLPTVGGLLRGWLVLLRSKVLSLALVANASLDDLGRLARIPGGKWNIVHIRQRESLLARRQSCAGALLQQRLVDRTQSGARL